MDLTLVGLRIRDWVVQNSSLTVHVPVFLSPLSAGDVNRSMGKFFDSVDRGLGEAGANTRSWASVSDVTRDELEAAIRRATSSLAKRLP